MEWCISYSRIEATGEVKNLCRGSLNSAERENVYVDYKDLLSPDMSGA